MALSRIKVSFVDDDLNINEEIRNRSKSEDVDLAFKNWVALQGLPSGGLQGQVLGKKSNADYDAGWIDSTKAEWGKITGNLGDQTDLSASLAGKQAIISDLDQIRAGAASGSTAYQKPSTGIPTSDLAEFFVAGGNTTYSELEDAYNKYKAMFYLDSEEQVYSFIAATSGDDYVFTSTDNAGTIKIARCNTSSVWTLSEVSLATSASLVSESQARQTSDLALQDEIDNLKARGRYLALWKCNTGLPASEPFSALPYLYKAGDYYIVGEIATGSALNYQPTGSSYIGSASTLVESREVAIDDVYYFDGARWGLQKNTQKTVSFVNLAGQPTDNLALSSSLAGKQNVISDLDSIRAGAALGSSSIQPVGSDELWLNKELWVGNEDFGKVAIGYDEESGPDFTIHNTDQSIYITPGLVHLESSDGWGTINIDENAGYPTIDVNNGLEDDREHHVRITTDDVELYSSGSETPYLKLSECKEVFVATYGVTTHADVLVAYNAGKVIFAKNSSVLAILASYSGTSFIFNTGQEYAYQYILSSSGWFAQSATLENTSHRVTTLTSSSTNTQYPSAKCTYDNLQLKEDTLEWATDAEISTLIDTIL